MNLPFASEQFLSVFEQYNSAVWPMQVFLNLLALVAVSLAIRPSPISSRIITRILAFLRFWIGIAYHFTFFADITSPVRVFGGAKVLHCWVRCPVTPILRHGRSDFPARPRSSRSAFRSAQTPGPRNQKGSGFRLTQFH